MARLLIRRPPIEGESWLGYLSRLAAANAMLDGLKGIARVLRTTVADLLKRSASTVCMELGLDPEIALSATQAEPPIDLTIRLCPACLAEDAIAFIRHNWNLPCAVQCDRHLCLLLETCPACHQRISYRRLRSDLFGCTCGADFRIQPVRPAPEWLQRLGTILKLSDYASQAQAATMLKCMVSLMDIRQRRACRNYGGRPRLQVNEALRLEPWLCDWPRSFTREFVLAWASAERGLKITRLRALDDWAKLLTSGSHERPLDLPPRLVTRAILNSLEEDAEPNARTYYQIAGRAADTLSWKEAGERLGLGDPILRMLVLGGFVRRLTEPGSSVRLVHRKDIESLRLALLANAKECLSSKFLMPLSRAVREVSSQRRQRPHSFVDFVSALTRGEIKIYATSNMAEVSDLTVLWSDVVQWLRS